MTRERILWRLASRAPLRWRGWDGNWVVFHPESGDTHLLDPLAVEVLRVLEVTPTSEDELIERFSDKSVSPGVSDPPGPVERLLSVLDEVGLIEPVDDIA